MIDRETLFYVINYTVELDTLYVGVAIASGYKPDDAIDTFFHDSNFNGYRDKIKVTRIEEIPKGDVPNLDLEEYMRTHGIEVLNLNGIVAGDIYPAIIGINGNWFIYNYKEKKYEDSGRSALGIRGQDGKPGIQGPPGRDGRDGKDGETAVIARTLQVFAFSKTKPAKPVGGSWNMVDNTFTYPTGPDGTIWGSEDSITERPVWTSYRTFSDKPELNTGWSDPFQISGNDGSDGADGVSIEFAYYIDKQSVLPPSPPPDGPVEGNVTGTWTDNPTGVSVDFPVEWVSSRKKKDESTPWSSWSTPTIWSRWGDNGKDGDGVEYIFFRNGGEPVNNPTPRKSALENDFNIDNPIYQETDEYSGIEFIPQGWTDNPKSTTEKPGETHVWVCIRKYRKGPKNPDGTPIEKYKDRTMWGPFSNPTLWANWGEAGDSGYNLRTMYAKTSKTDSNIAPIVGDRTDINPGSIWSVAVPFYSASDETLWQIKAYTNDQNQLVWVRVYKTEKQTDEEWNKFLDDLRKSFDDQASECIRNIPNLGPNEKGIEFRGWQGPWIISGANGRDGIPVNYKTYAYYNSKDKPSIKPSINIKPDQLDNGWVDYPNTSGLWWQCIGTVDGEREIVTAWGEILPVNGEAKDGKYTEFRFKVSPKDTLSLTAEEKQTRNIEGWTVEVPYKSKENNLFMINAEISPEELLVREWSDPVRISGEQGPIGNTGPAGEPGPTGSQGVSGIPGVSFETRFCLGDTDSYLGTPNPEGENPEGWDKQVPKVTELHPYIWCIQGRRVYYQKEYTLKRSKEECIHIGDAYKEADGSIQILIRFQAGNKVFSTDYIAYRIEWEKPFRLSGTNGVGVQGKKGQIIYPRGIYSTKETYVTNDYKAPYVFDPSDNNFYVLNTIMAWNGEEQGSPSNPKYPHQDLENWVQFESVEALYAKIGVIANGLIGSAVFNGDYMFSQQGWIDPTVDPAPTYADFNSKDPYGEKNVFKPNICINFNTGDVWLNSGKTHFKYDGSGFLANEKITWTSDGNFSVKGSTIGTTTVGPWKIDANQNIYDGDTLEDSNIVFKSNGDFILAKNKINWKGVDNILNIDGAIKAAVNSKIGPWLINSKGDLTSKFCTITPDGHISAAEANLDKLIATNATINGKLTAGNGSSLGPWKVTNGSLGDGSSYQNSTTWFDSTGKGKLANGNIYWDAQGNLNIKGELNSELYGKINIGPWKVGKESINGTIHDVVYTGDSVETSKTKFVDDGSGHLASKNISWTKDGNTTIDGELHAGDGSSLGPWRVVNGSLGDGSSYDDSTTWFDKSGRGKLAHGNIAWNDTGKKLTIKGEFFSLPDSYGSTAYITSGNIAQVAVTNSGGYGAKMSSDTLFPKNGGSLSLSKGTGRDIHNSIDIDSRSMTLTCSSSLYDSDDITIQFKNGFPAKTITLVYNKNRGTISMSGIQKNTNAVKGELCIDGSGYLMIKQ